MIDDQILQCGLAALGCTLTDDQVDHLLRYVTFLQKWQKSYNLVADASSDVIIYRHILDSLSIAPFIYNPRNLDIGTGAGFPGMVLAIAYPDLHFSLMDSNGKKTRFLQQLCFELKMDNVDVIQSRIEKYQTTRCFNDIISRAVAPVSTLLRLSAHCLCSGGRWLLMKGTNPTEEIADVAYPTDIHALSVPGTTAQPHLVIVKG